ncbi:MAG: hypothetical protein HYU57_02595 [Micavibrio aeruginosavorus]|nr:hypothetical protein [Micavibrio aeruginosavorus]
MPPKFPLIPCLFLAATLFAAPAMAQQETPITVMVQSSSGTPFATTLGNAQVTMRDKITGDTLASGVTDHGKLGLSLDLPRPTPVSITAMGPLAQQQGMVSATHDMLLIPGKDYSAGNGIVMTLPGVVVDLVTPTPGQVMTSDAEKDVIMTAHVIGMDGKPAEAGRYEVEATIYIGSVIAGKTPMTAGSTPGEFTAKARFPGAGTYIVAVTAFDAQTKEGGVDQTAVSIIPGAGEQQTTGKKK